MRFETDVLLEGVNPYVVLPEPVAAALSAHAHGGRIRVTGTLEGAALRGTVVPRADGHRLFLHAGMRADAGVGVGDRVTLDLTATPWDVVTGPPELEAEPAWQDRDAAARHELLRWIEVATTPGARADRLTRTVAMLRGERLGPGDDGRALRPLWTCPKCEHRFTNRNQWHSCKRYELDDVFAKSEPFVRGLFEAVREAIEEIGPVSVQAYRGSAAFLVRVRFASATPRRRWLNVGVWLRRRLESPRFTKVETLTPSDHVHRLKLTDPSEIDDELRALLAEAYEIGAQRA